MENEEWGIEMGGKTEFLPITKGLSIQDLMSAPVYAHQKSLKYY